ncbi:hypothetical protein KEM54_000439, partial [Ascosphaera aggregata]
MPITGLYFIPSSASTSSYSLLEPFVERFQAAYQNATFTGRWALEHRLLRDTPSTFQVKSNDGDSLEPRYMHFLNLSTFPNQAFIYASPLPKRELEEAAAAAAAATKLLASSPESPTPVAPLPPVPLVEKNKTTTEPEPLLLASPSSPSSSSSLLPTEAHPDDELQLLQQQEMLFKQHLEKHREQQQQLQRMQQEEEERKAKEAERRRLEEQQVSLFQHAAASSSSNAAQQINHRQPGEQQNNNGQQLKNIEEEEEEEGYDEKRMVMIVVDTASFYTWYNITLRAAQPLWVPRHTVTVPSLTSSIFEIADFRVRIGEVKQVAPVTRTRGLIVEIEYNGLNAGRRGESHSHLQRRSQSQNSHSSPYYSEKKQQQQQQQQQRADRRPLTDSDWEVGEVLIREFWNRFAIPGAKEYIRVRD